MQKSVLIFDLDQTVICSKHRTPLKNSSVNLAEYRKLQTLENIKKDQLLPLAGLLKENFKRKKCFTVILTARRMTKADYYFLRKHKLRADLVLSRDQLFRLFDLNLAELIYSCNDAEYKSAYLIWLRNKLKIDYHQMILFDDNQSILKAASSLGVKCYDAIQYNKMLANI